MRTRAGAGFASDLRSVPIIGATALLWAYILSIFVYKTWYITTAVVTVMIAMAVAAGAIRTRGVVSASWPVFLYFGVLLAGAGWALYPANTFLWVAIDSIEIVVFVIFFVVGRNSRPSSIGAALMTTIIPAVVISVVMYRLDPTVSRLAHYALPLLAVSVPFIWLFGMERGKRWHATLTLAVLFALLLAARSRAPLAAAGVAAALSMFTFRRSLIDLFRRVALVALVATVVVGGLLAVRVTRPLVVTTFVRFAHVSVAWGDLYIEAEPVDPVRREINKLALALTTEIFPRGIGYMNFISYFNEANGYEVNLHSMYESWLTEGGLACVLVVALIAWRHIAGLGAVIRRAPTREARMYAQACLIASLAVALLGFFHQMHQTPVFWMVLGLGSAAARQTKEGTAAAREHSAR